MLLEANADPAAATSDGQNAADVAAPFRHVQTVVYEHLSSRAHAASTRFPSAELVASATRGDYNRAVALLRARADPNASDAQCTALQRACAERDVAVAQLLLQHRADPARVARSGA